MLSGQICSIFHSFYVFLAQHGWKIRDLIDNMKFLEKKQNSEDGISSYQSSVVILVELG